MEKQKKNSEIFVLAIDCEKRLKDLVELLEENNDRTREKVRSLLEDFSNVVDKYQNRFN